MRSSARTAPASRRSSRSSPACTPRTAARSASARRSSPPSPRATRWRAASPRSTRSCCSSPSSRSPRTSSSATPRPRAPAGSTGRRCAAASRRLLDSLDSHDLDVDAKVGTLSVANRQRVEIAKALSQNARVLIMDEPTAALADADVRRLMDVVRRLRERGVGIVYVSHKLPEIFELADRVTVLRDGALIGTRPIGEVTEQTPRRDDGRARDRRTSSRSPSRSIGETVLKVEGPRLRRPLPRRLLRAPPRRDPRHGRPRRLRPHRAGADDLRHHPGHRRHDRARGPPGRHHLAAPGVRPRHRLRARGPRPAGPGPADDRRREHLDGVARGRSPRGIFIRFADEARHAAASIRQLGIRARGPEQVVGQLSGGNQQKVVLGKWLETEPEAS